jgi:hypothetical protein
MKNNKKVTMASKARAAGITEQVVYNRLFHGWSEKKALSVPVRKKAKPKFQLKGLTTKPPKKTVAYKVEPKKEQAVGSRVKIPMEGVQKFEYPKDNMLVYVVVVAVIVVIVAMMAT